MVVLVVAFIAPAPFPLSPPALATEGSTFLSPRSAIAMSGSSTTTAVTVAEPLSPASLNFTRARSTDNNDDDAATPPPPLEEELVEEPAEDAATAHMASPGVKVAQHTKFWSGCPPTPGFALEFAFDDPGSPFAEPLFGFVVLTSSLNSSSNSSPLSTKSSRQMGCVVDLATFVRFTSPLPLSKTWWSASPPAPSDTRTSAAAAATEASYEAAFTTFTYESKWCALPAEGSKVTFAPRM
mmetsp:Transcript_17347/g.31851  ORF Transcript_17347/g.31851 Transcript_17347/m.31851 type:complete len:239 (+) Transcript_17347:261-977(+)